ncbi:MAG: hypothetical protein KAW41_01010 [Candidatus Diapherotrites archaeon]|nr:hypothetical protein [Candidatus Diapherotrites archaeon]
MGKNPALFVLFGALLVFGLVLTSGCTQSGEEIPEEELTFTVLPKLPDARAGVPYPPHPFCEPDSARSGATCGGLAGETTNPIGGNPPYFFTVEFGAGFVPTGMALELNGLLRGTPITEGTYTFGVCANDGTTEKCQSTTVIVKPEKEPTPTPTATPTSTPTPTPTPTAILDVTADVKVTSLTCTFTNEDKYGWADIQITSAGTATGPVGSSLTPPYVWPEDAVDCGAWTVTSEYGVERCIRNKGDAETTSWTHTTPVMYIITSAFKTMHVDASIFVDGVAMGYDERKVQCG